VARIRYVHATGPTQRQSLEIGTHGRGRGSDQGSIAIKERSLLGSFARILNPGLIGFVRAVPVPEPHWVRLRDFGGGPSLGSFARFVSVVTPSLGSFGLL
jgi:hypothetical protein